MSVCKNCNVKIIQGELYRCPNCNATVCQSCSMNTKKICPYCYHDLEING